MFRSRLPFVLLGLQVSILAGLVQHGGMPLWLLALSSLAIVTAFGLFVIGSGTKPPA